MAELIVEGPELVVRLSWLEKLAALRGTSASRCAPRAPSGSTWIRSPRSPDWSCR
jgi:hypothetical protein